MCLLSWWEAVARWLTWWHQLCNGWGGSDDKNSDDNNDNNVETTTKTTTIMRAGSVGINTGMDAAAALSQGSITLGKCSQCQHQCQRLMTTGIGALQQ